MSKGAGDRKLYQFVDALIEIGEGEIVRALKVDAEQAREVMREVAHGICFRYGRTTLYVPADLQFGLSKRDEEIWRQYGLPGPDGSRPYTAARVAQIAEEYKLTSVRIYQIVKTMQARELAARQGELEGL